MRKLLVAVGACLLTAVVSAGPPPLIIVDVGLPDMNCFFSTNCTIAKAHDFVSWLTIPGTTGQGIVQSRTYVGQPGAPLAGYAAYVYRVDVTGIQSSPLAPAYVQSLTVPFAGEIINRDYDHNGTTNDDVWVMTSGSGGTVNLSSAISTRTNITFTFSQPIACAVGTNAGQSSLYFGITSTRANELAIGQVKATMGTNLFTLTVTNLCPAL